MHQIATAFRGTAQLASGDLPTLIGALHDLGGTDGVLVFDDRTASPIELDLRGSREEAIARLATDPSCAYSPSALSKTGCAITSNRSTASCRSTKPRNGLT